MAARPSRGDLAVGLHPGLVTVLAVTVLAGGCGLGEAGTSSGPGGKAEGTGIHVRYESVHEGGESGGVPQLVDVLVQGDRFRMSLSDATAPGEVHQTVVWDGDAMLLLEGEDASRQEAPPAEERPPSYIIRAGDGTFEQLCRGGTPDGSARVASREGTVYTCPAHDTGGTEGESSRITLDDATGLLLRRVSASSRMVAVEVELDVAVEDGTFSTAIPPGMRGAQEAGGDGSGVPPPLTATESVPRAGGGELLLEDIRQGPSLVVVGELPGVTAMLARILPRTGQGTAPPVYVLLNPIPFDEPDTSDLPLATQEGTQKLIDEVSASVGDVPVPVGIDIKGGAAGEELRSFEDIMAGTTVLAAIDASGALAWRMTDGELATSAGRLDEWIVSNT